MHESVSSVKAARYRACASRTTGIIPNREQRRTSKTPDRSFQRDCRPDDGRRRLPSSTAPDDLVLDAIRILEEHRVVVRTMLRKEARPIDDVCADPREL